MFMQMKVNLKKFMTFDFPLSIDTVKVVRMMRVQRSKVSTQANDESLHLHALLLTLKKKKKKKDEW